MLEVKELTDKIQTTWEAMKAKNDEVLAEAKSINAARAEDKLTLDKMAADLEGTKAALDELGLKVERHNLVPNGDQPSEEAKARRAAFFKWLRHGKAGMEPTERKALVEDTTGLILVPEDVEAEILRALPALTPMRGICRQRTTNRDKVRVRSITEVSVGWGKLETGTEITESTSTPSDDYVYVEDLYGLTKIGEDELMDSDANLAAIIADSFAQAIAAAENTAFVAGLGHTTYGQPAGISADTTLRTSLLTGCGAGAAGTYGISWATDDTAIPDDMLKAEYALPAQYLRGATWLMHRKTELAIRLVKEATTGAYLWQPSLVAGAPNNFDGYPIVNSSDMPYPAEETAETNVVFGNFQEGYLIVDRQGMALQRLDELYAEAGLIGFKAHFRVGGGLIRYAPFQIIVNDV